jgi:cold shock CspA family protein/ribosome-associated translation inhibitor RaiA
MNVPLQVTYRGVQQAELVTKYVRERAEALEKYAPQLMSCRVIIEAPHRRHREGRIFHVRIDMTVPGAEVVVGRDPAMKHAHEDVFVAIRDAFDAARRRLEDYSRRRRGLVKHHEIRPVARVVNLYPDNDYGFLEASDGRRVYFHRNAVLEDGFDRLEIGAHVLFSEEEGEKGPQARTVEVLQRHAPAGVEE